LDFFFEQEGFDIDHVNVFVTVNIAKRDATHINSCLRKIAVQNGRGKPI
jgi:hypothetical protein